jgi:hypothetical protein
MGCRVMATDEPPKLGREGSIPSQPANTRHVSWGDISTAESCFRTAGIRVQLPVAPPRGRSSARRALRWHRRGCRCDSGRLHQHPRGNTRVPKGWKSVFQTDERGSIPLIRSSETNEPILWVRIAACKAVSEGSIPSRLSTQTNGSRRDGDPELSDKELALRSIRR